MSFSPNFKALPYTADERAALAEARKYDDEEDVADLEWTTSTGQSIKIFRDSNGFAIDIDGKMSFNNLLSDDVPANDNGIVARLGRVGLTAERKAEIEALRKWGK